jgi:hypothetical protein
MALVPCPECKAQVSPAAASCPRCGFPFAPAPGGAFRDAAAGARSGPPTHEEVLWEGTPSLKALAVSIAATALLVIALPLGAYLAWEPLLGLVSGAGRDAARLVAEHEGTAHTAVVLGVLAVVLVQAARLAWQVMVLRSHRYGVSNQRIMVESGVFSKTLAEVDVRTIDDITFYQSFVERLLGIGQISVLSSEPSNPRVKLVGVPDPRQVRELIRNSAYQATRGQLFTRST